MSMYFDWKVRVYYEDTDAAGIVYHANYLKYMERARTEWLRFHGFSQERLKNDENIVFAVRDSVVSFVKSATLDEELAVQCVLDKRKNASLVMVQTITNNNSEIICKGIHTIACISTISRKAKRIPSTILEAIYDGD